MLLGTKIVMLYWREFVISGCAIVGFHCIPVRKCHTTTLSLSPMSLTCRSAMYNSTLTSSDASMICHIPKNHTEIEKVQWGYKILFSHFRRISVLASLSEGLSVDPSVCMSIYLSVRPSVCPFAFKKNTPKRPKSSGNDSHPRYIYIPIKLLETQRKHRCPI